MRRYISDFMIKDMNEQLLALVEVKGDLDSSRERASLLRRNVLAHTFAAEVPYFVILTPSIGYLWKSNPALDAANSLKRPPDAEFPTSGILQYYVPDQGERTGQVGSVLELILFQWLSDLTNGPQDRDLGEKKALANTGFLEALRGANVTLEGELARIR